MAASRLPADAIGDPRRAVAWSAYDPTEGRMDSDDPLGFAAGALRIADRILPGLTVRTLDLRYYLMVSVGLLAVEQAESDRERRRQFLVWEKLWALGRVATGQGRGVLGVNGAARHLASAHRLRLDGRFVLLQRQPFLGALGSYTTSLEALALKAKGSMSLTESGRELAVAALKEASSSSFWRNLLEAIRVSIRDEKDRVADNGKYGVSHDRLASVGRLNASTTETLRDCLFSRTTSRGRATRFVLPAIREAALADLVALETLVGNRHRDEGLAVLARHALAIEDVTCVANFALERILGAAVASGYAISVDQVPSVEPRWGEIERLLNASATRAATALADADLPNELATAGTLAELRGATLVTELIKHHERVMNGRSARRWALLEGDRVHALRIPVVPSEPEPIRHAYRFGSARVLAMQAGLK
jgi:hypothetical protein